MFRFWFFSFGFLLQTVFSQLAPLATINLVVTQVDTQLFELSSPEFPETLVKVDTETLASALRTKFQCDELTQIDAKYVGQDGYPEEFSGKGVRDLQAKVRSSLQRTYKEAKKADKSSSGGADGTGATGATDSSGGLKFKACLHGQSTVETPNGPATIAELINLGDKVQVATMDNDGNILFAPVNFWLHYEPQTTAIFILFETATNHTVALTPDHLIFVSNCDRPEDVPTATRLAKEVSVGDCLWVRSSSDRTKLFPSAVVSRKMEKKRGIFAPVTSAGTILVDNILSSCYSRLNSPRLQSLAIAYLTSLHHLADLMLPQAIVNSIFGADVNGNLPVSPVLSAFDDLTTLAIR